MLSVNMCVCLQDSFTYNYFTCQIYDLLIAYTSNIQDSFMWELFSLTLLSLTLITSISPHFNCLCGICLDLSRFLLQQLRLLVLASSIVQYRIINTWLILGSSILRCSYYYLRPSRRQNTSHTLGYIVGALEMISCAC